MSLSITIPGRPPTKKNSRRADWSGRITRPSKAYSEYYDFCIGTKSRPGWLCQWGNVSFNKAVHVCARYWMPHRGNWPDLLGLEQATADILEAAGIIENDRLIYSWDGSRIEGVDKENPRVEITIEEEQP